MHSVFADMTAEETLAHHRGTLRALRVQHIVMVLVLGAMALFGAERGMLVLYLLGLAGIVATFLLFFYRWRCYFFFICSPDQYIPFLLRCSYKPDV